MSGVILEVPSIGDSDFHDSDDISSRQTMLESGLSAQQTALSSWVWLKLDHTKPARTTKSHTSLQAVVNHALAESGLARLIAETQSANSASCRLLREQGMVEIKRLDRFGEEQIVFATI